MICKNEKCFGGYVRRFRGRRGKRPAGFFDELCPACKGDWHKPEPIPKRVREAVQPSLFRSIEPPPF